MPKFQPKRDEQIFSRMLARVIARTDMTDVTDASAVKHVLAAAARGDGDIYYQLSLLLKLFSIDSATGDDLDARAKDVQPSVIRRRQATRAVGTVVFSRTGTTGTITIPIGTKVKTAGGVIFATTEAGSISALSVEQISGHGVGRDSLEVAVIADVAGSTGRVAAETVIKFVTKPNGVDEVTNPSAFVVAGVDREEDDDFRARIKRFIASLARSTVQALEAALVGAQDPDTGAVILFARAVEDISTPAIVTLYIDDGTGTAEATEDAVDEVVTAALEGPPVGAAVGGETKLLLSQKPIKIDVEPALVSDPRGALTRGVEYTLNPADGQLIFDPPLEAAEVITASYTYYTGLVAYAQKVIDGDKDDRENFPGFRAAGVFVFVDVPQVLLQNVVASLVIKEGYTALEVEAAVVEAIKAYINALEISGDVISRELSKRIMQVPGVFDISALTPASNTVLLDDQLARTTDDNIDVS